MKINLLSIMTLAASAVVALPVFAANNQIIHDAEHYILAAQHGDKWMTEDKAIDAKLG